MNPAQKASVAQDARPVHGFIFDALTPQHFPYFAGHYRGERFRCLQTYEVGIRSDKRVGHPAATVPLEMAKLALEIGHLVGEIDLFYAAPNNLFSSEQKLFRAVELCAAVFVYFLEIHPFANRNCHIARLIIQSLLGRHGVYFNPKWAIHPRPQEPAYSNAIAQYRDGNEKPLRLLLLSCI